MLRNFITQRTQIQGEITLSCSSDEFQRALEQRMLSCPKHKMETIDHQLLQQAETRGYLGWVGNDEFIIRPVAFDKKDPVNRFIIEGSFHSDRDLTIVRFIIRPDLEGRWRMTFIFWSTLLVIGLMAVLWAIPSSIMVFISTIIAVVFALNLLLISFKPYLPDCKARFEKVLQSLKLER